MAPPLPPKPLGVPVLGTTAPSIVVEVFWDLCCPFSKKMCQTLLPLEDDSGVVDQVRNDPILSKRVEFIIHNVPQPWHPQSPMLSEALMAVSNAFPKANVIVSFIQHTYQAWPQFTDKYTAHQSRIQIHQQCADIAVRAVAADAAQTGNTATDSMIRDAILLQLSTPLLQELTDENPNGGLGSVTQALKWTVKYHRSRGIHVTPTVFINGMEAVDVSSAWTCQAWMEKLRSMVSIINIS
jgi:hypothetical protein